MTDVFSREHVLAQWAYSELRSKRNVDYQARGVAEELVQKACQGVPFDQLAQEERRNLHDGWLGVRAVPMFTELVKDVAIFELRGWDKSDLAAVQIMPYFAPDIEAIRFDIWMDTEPIQPRCASDPRCAAFATRSPQPDPITVGRNADGALVLIDGYHRAVAFWRSGDPHAQTILAYVPM